MIEYLHYIKYYHTFGIQFRRRIPIVKSMDAKSMGAATLERKNDIKIGGKFDCDSNGDIYRHKNFRQIFLPLQVKISYYFVTQKIKCFVQLRVVDYCLMFFLVKLFRYI